MNTFAMYRALLAQQWKHQRVEITAMAIAAAVVCPVALWFDVGLDLQSQPWRLTDTAVPIATMGSLTALLTGMLLAIRPYALDAQTRHTYALTLPVPRSRYSALRVADGLTLALVPIVAFFIGASMAAQMAPPSAMVHAYPFQLSIRFLLGVVLAFAIGFGVQYGLGRRAVRLIMLAALTVGGVELIGQLTIRSSVTEPFWSLLAHEGSPFRVFLSRWALFNV